VKKSQWKDTVGFTLYDLQMLSEWLLIIGLATLIVVGILLIICCCYRWICPRGKATKREATRRRVKEPDEQQEKQAKISKESLKIKGISI
jgi:hypothetical protein